MNILLDFDKQLGISAEKFIVAWNDHATASQLATAKEDASPPITYNDPLTIVVLTVLATGLVTMSLDVLKEQINAVLKSMREEKQPAGETLFIPDNAELERIRAGDGSELITIRIPPKKK